MSHINIFQEKLALKEEHERLLEKEKDQRNLMVQGILAKKNQIENLQREI